MTGILLLLLCLTRTDPVKGDFYVSPDGRDTDAGTIERPFATLARARDAARASKQPTILVRGGTYFLPETLSFSSQDGSVTFAAFPGEEPVVSGGRRITGWREAGNGVWTAAVPDKAFFRQLFVNGRRAVRARTPNVGAFYRVQGEITLDKPCARFRFAPGEIKPEWAEKGDVEVIALQAWAELRMPLKAVEGETAVLAGACATYNRERDPRYWLENAPDMLDAPGEWHLDRDSGVVSYRPLPGEDVSRVEAVAAGLRELVRIEGAQGIRFKGLTFAHADWTLPEKGYADTQAAYDIPAAFTANGAGKCVLEDGTFVHLGGYAVEFARGCRENRIVGNEMADLGAGGMRIGEPRLRQEPADRTEKNVVTDNHIHDIGNVYPAGVGVWVGQSGGNLLAHNHIHDTYYSGFSLGWSWGYAPTAVKDNIVEYNLVHHIGRGMLADMGGIYTLGVSPGTAIRNNVFHDIESSTYGGWGIYFDEGSMEITAENNLVYRCKSNGFHQHYGRENVVRNNIFVNSRQSQVARSREEEHLSFTFEKNVVSHTEGTLLSGNWKNGKFRFARNVYWPAGTPDDWKGRGLDEGSVVADPLFVDPARDDFRLKPGSPAFQLGFKAFDVSKVGPRPRGLDSRGGFR